MEVSEEKLAELLAYVSGRLSGSRRRQIESELAKDTELCDYLSCLRSLSCALLGEDYPELQKPSRALVRRVLKEVKKCTKAGDIKTGIATFDSQLLPLPSGVRPAKVSTRQMRFNTDQLSLELSLYPVTSASYQLIGKISGVKKEIRHAIRLQSGRTKLKCDTNEFHIFQMNRVPAGKCKLTVQENTKVIMIVELEL
ncbi:MAG: hypothetical protein KOO62_08400 [candidate division Zixibacteria bacterium]|nr:hypothetical protein [candidate division Zixibacteria bacterium]